VRPRLLAVGGALLAVTTSTLAAGPAPAGPSAPPGTSAGALPRAAPTWGPVKRLDRNPQGESLVVDARNVTTVVWATAARSIVAIRRPDGGPWGRRVVIGRGYAPQVVADARGNLTVAWLNERRGFTDGVMAARRPVGGGWSDPVRISRDRRVPGYPADGLGSWGAESLDLAVNARGDAAVSWDWGSDERAVPWRVRSAYRPAGGPWRSPQRVTPADGSRDPQLGVGDGGTVLLVHTGQSSESPLALASRRRLPGGSWTGPTRVTPRAFDWHLAVDRRGNAVLVFSDDLTTVRAVHRPGRGTWSAPRTLSPAGVEVGSYDLTMNRRGAAAVAMAREDNRIDLVRRPPGGPWTSPVRIARPGPTTGVAELVVALNGAGDTFVAWGTYALVGIYRPRGEVWSAPFTLSPDAGVEVLEDTYAAVAPDGDVVVLWDQEERPLKVRVMDAS
jgi:hypothetical protein